MEPKLIDQEPKKIPAALKYKVIADGLMIMAILLIGWNLIGYFSMRSGFQSVYLPSYAVDFTFYDSAIRMIIVTVGMLFCQLFNLFKFTVAALAILAVSLLLYFSYPYLPFEYLH
jgi:hypothetical protein